MKTAIFSFLFLMSVSIAASGQSLPLNVDLKDIVEHGPSAAKPEAKHLIEQIQYYPEAFGLPPGITYSNTQMTGVGQNVVSTAEVQNHYNDGFDVYLVYTYGKRVYVNRVEMDYQHQVRGVKTFDLSKNPPSAQIDVLNRQMFLSEPKSGFMKVLPVSVGALVDYQANDYVTKPRSLTKTFSRAMLSRTQSDVSRIKPDYYAGRPFLRVIDFNQSQHGGFTPFGVHYQISDVLLRGFISNGCFRLRDNDLYELASMVFLTEKNGVPFTVVDSTNYGNIHPYPSINSWFNTPRIGVDANGKTVFVNDEHGLYVFDRVNQRPADLLRRDY